LVKGEPGFTVTAGSCTVTSGGSCFQSVNYPSNYGDNEQCSIRVDGTVNNEKLYSGFFLTENCCDKLTINGTQYKGSNGPSGVTVATNQVITWYTDGSATMKGFNICFGTGTCTNTQGQQINNAICGCGTALCSVGDYCTASLDLCHGPPCSTTNGSEANLAPCKCGNEACSEDTGLICYSDMGGGSCRKLEMGEFGYPRLTSGDCVTQGISGRAIIQDEETCRLAAVNMGLSDTTVYVHSSSSRPPGCYMKSTSELYFNPSLTSNGACDMVWSKFCICLAGPVCTKTQGTEANPAACLCGNSLCTSGQGLHCTASTSFCSGPPCSTTNGSEANLAPCKCGNEACSDDTGLICYSDMGGGSCRKSSLGTFGYPRVYTSNCDAGIDQHKIKDEAACGSAALDIGLADTTVYQISFDHMHYPLGCYMSSRYGLTFNSASSSMKSCSDADFCICIATSACENSDGTGENQESCMCGSSLCRPDDGLYCTSSINMCNGPPCTTTNGSAINLEPCKCGNEACTASTGLICFSEVGGGSCRKQDVGAFGYNRLRSGHCIGSGLRLSGQTIINNADRCQTAATSMGLITAKEVINSVYPSTSRPPGCYLKDTGEVYFNSVLSSTASCSSSATFCICLSVPNCFHTDGLTQNDALCTCGTSVCDQSIGLYCTAILNSCHEQTCSIVDGSAVSVLPNSQSKSFSACQCGQESCTGLTGLICFATVGSGSCRVQDPGNYGFNRMYTGRCLDPSVAGRNLIQDQALCEEAATSIGLTNQTATVVTSLDDPPGCSLSSNGLVFNLDYSSPASCSTPSMHCICMSAPLCINSDGLVLNPGKALFCFAK
jgi:hypothetical protein